MPGHIWVPMDDDNCMVYNWMYSTTDAPLTEEDRRERGIGNGPISCRPDDVPLEAEPDEQLRSRPRGAEDRELHRHRRHQPAGPRLAGKHGAHRRSLEGASRAGRQGDRPGAQLLRAAVKTVEAGGDPAGTGTSYYHIRAGEEVLPRDADWHAVLAPDITKEKILQTV